MYYMWHGLITNTPAWVGACLRHAILSKLIQLIGSSIFTLSGVWLVAASGAMLIQLLHFAAKMLVTVNSAMLKIGKYMSVTCLSVCHDRQYQNFKDGIIPGPYLTLMYNMKKLLRAVSEKSLQTEVNTDAQGLF